MEQRMSVDWFISRFENDEPSEFSTSRLSEAFSNVGKREHLVEDTIWWDLDCGSSMTAGKTGAKSTDSLLINRPALVPELIEAIYDLLKEEGMVLFSADLDKPFVANQNTRRHLPDDMIQSLGEPIKLESAKHLQEEL